MYKHFERIVPFFMYLVPDISFQQTGFATSSVDTDWISSKCQTGGFINRSKAVNAGSKPNSQPRYQRCDCVKSNNTFARKPIYFGSLPARRCSSQCNGQGMIKSCGGIDPVRGHFYPIAYWRPQDVQSYLSANDIPLPPEYRIFGTGASYGGIVMEHVEAVYRDYPPILQRSSDCFH